MWYQNIGSRFFLFVTKHACYRRTDEHTDGQTDGENYDPQDRASIAASRGKNWWRTELFRDPYSVVEVLRLVSLRSNRRWLFKARTAARNNGSHNDGAHVCSCYTSYSSLHRPRTCLSSTIHRTMYQETRRPVPVCHEYSGCWSWWARRNDRVFRLCNEMYSAWAVSTFQPPFTSLDALPAVLQSTDRVQRY